MTSQTAARQVPLPISAAFEQLAGLGAILTALVGFLYAVSFVIVSRSAPDVGGLLNALFLMLGGLFTTAALAGVYGRLRAADETMALWALLLGFVGAAGAAAHGGFDLANIVQPASATPADLPSPIDPRGLLTFGLAGMAQVANGWLIARSGALPRGLGYLGYVLGGLLIVIYLARLIVLSPANPILLIPVLVSGFVVNPAWYAWLGISLWRARGMSA